MRELPGQQPSKELTTFSKLELFMIAKRHFKQIEEELLPKELELRI